MSWAFSGKVTHQKYTAMHPKELVKVSNLIGTISIALLIYWIFSFMLIEVFGLKIFGENITQIFYMSVLGILALMAGALMINIMFNLTRLADRDMTGLPRKVPGRRWLWTLGAVFPLLAIVFFTGDYLTQREKEKHLVRSASSMIGTMMEANHEIMEYQFTSDWIDQTRESLAILSRTDHTFPQVAILVRDTIGGTPVFLGFSEYIRRPAEEEEPYRKLDFIHRTTDPERDYLHRVFAQGATEYRYSAHDGTYEIFYPYVEGENRIVLYFSQHKRYGKIGS